LLAHASHGLLEDLCGGTLHCWGDSGHLLGIRLLEVSAFVDASIFFHHNSICVCWWIAVALSIICWAALLAYALL
jgi:hypothetical protein